LKGLAVLVSSIVFVGASGCTSFCDNAGVTVDGAGAIVVKGESGFVSPNSTILRNVRAWPRPPGGEQNFALSQGYVLTRDGAMYVLANTAYHPNLVYRIDLAIGRATKVGSQSGAEGPGAMTKSKETSVATSARYAYSVDGSAGISRADLAKERLTLTPFIGGPRTLLRSPVSVAVSKDEDLCALDSQTLFLLCYSSRLKGDVAPTAAIDLKRLLGYAQVWDVVFDRSGRVVVSGTSDPAGLAGYSIAVLDVSKDRSRIVRTISGPNAKLSAPQLAVDALGDILVLTEKNLTGSDRELIAFGPKQRGDVPPLWVRDPPASVTNPFQIAVDEKTNDIAVLGSDGVALFPGAADRPPAQWPGEVRLPLRGWSVGFGGRSSVIVADEFGDLERSAQGALSRPARSRESTRLNLHNPQFIAADQNGRVYVASTDGVITGLAHGSDASDGWKTTTFATRFGRNMDAFAADSAGYFYLASASNDAVLAIDARGHQSVLSGTRTELNHPLGLTVNRDGLLFVANTSGNDILIFARNSSGDAAPIGKIAGPATGLAAPQALAIDAAGKLYVFDGPQTTLGWGGQHYVRVYGSTARGDAAPLESYPVKTKCWLNAP
jgi:hypothetical protein